MEEMMGSPRTYYRSYEGDRKLELVDPTTLRPIKKVFIVRESRRSRASSHLPPKPPKSKSSRHSSSLKGWWKDADVKRKRRVAKYKLYSAEAKVKASFRRGLKWFQRQCSKIIHGL